MIDWQKVAQERAKLIDELAGALALEREEVQRHKTRMERVVEAERELEISRANAAHYRADREKLEREIAEDQIQHDASMRVANHVADEATAYAEGLAESLEILHLAMKHGGLTHTTLGYSGSPRCAIVEKLLAKNPNLAGRSTTEASAPAMEGSDASRALDTEASGPVGLGPTSDVLQTGTVFAGSDDQMLADLAAERAARDWPEDFDREPGPYTCQCVECGQHFTGHKRRVVCRSCDDDLRPTPMMQAAKKMHAELIPSKQQSEIGVSDPAAGFDDWLMTSSGTGTLLAVANSECTHGEAVLALQTAWLAALASKAEGSCLGAEPDWKARYGSFPFHGVGDGQK